MKDAWKLALDVDGGLDFEGYQRLAQRTSANFNSMDKIENGLMGLNGEAGECIDILKKHKFQGHELDKEKIKDELGGVLWYCAELAEGLGITLQEVAEYNIAKLYKRYPEGFSVDNSVNRIETQQLSFDDMELSEKEREWKVKWIVK